MNALRLSVGLLTAVPVGRLPALDRRVAGAAMVLAPVTAVPVCVLLALAHTGVREGTPPLLAAALVVTAAVLISRAMHLDGLADTADGLSAGYDASTSLRAMKASDVGPSGVAAVVLALLLQVAALAELIGTGGGAALAALAWLTSRHSLAWACRRGVPAAQRTGLGALVAGTVGSTGLAAGLAALAALAVALPALWAAAVAGPTTPFPGGWWAGPAVALSGLAAAGGLVRRCRRRLGGISGDVLGAAIEVSLTASLVVGALLVGLA